MNVRAKGFDLPKKNLLSKISAIDKEHFTLDIKELGESWCVDYVRAYGQERTPAAFCSAPLLWESIRRWLALRLNVREREIGLSGSAQLGFSIHKGHEFDPQGSDLDLFLVNARIYDLVESEVRKFCASGGARYDSQIQTVSRSTKNGWIDVKHVPADHQKYPEISKLLNEASIVIDKLGFHDFKLKPSSFRIYKDWGTLAYWVKLSYSTVLQK